MSEFLESFLNEDLPSHPAGQPRVHLGVFGKHPGWNDHIDDIGLETPSLVTAKRMIYLQGISSQIDQNAWERLEGTKRSPHFDHVFLWMRPGEFLVGRMWSSSDGKGRTRYPMILAAHCGGLTLGWAWQVLLPLLEQCSQQCRAARTAPEVVDVTAATLRVMRQQLVAQPVAAGEALLPPTGFAKWLAHFSGGREGLYRLYHHLRNQLEAYAPGEFDPSPVGAAQRSRHLRLPAFEGWPFETINPWAAFLLTDLDPAVPMLLVQPVGQTWLDAIVGEPVPGDLFCLQASPAVLPLVTDIPYQVDENLKARLQFKIDDIAMGQMPSQSFFNGESTADNLHSSMGLLERMKPGKSSIFGKFMGKLRGTGLTRAPWQAGS